MTLPAVFFVPRELCFEARFRTIWYEPFAASSRDGICITFKISSLNACVSSDHVPRYLISLVSLWCEIPSRSQRAPCRFESRFHSYYIWNATTIRLRIEWSVHKAFLRNCFTSSFLLRNSDRFEAYPCRCKSRFYSYSASHTILHVVCMWSSTCVMACLILVNACGIHLLYLVRRRNDIACNVDHHGQASRPALPPLSKQIAVDLLYTIVMEVSRYKGVLPPTFNSSRIIDMSTKQGCRTFSKKRKRRRWVIHMFTNMFYHWAPSTLTFLRLRTGVIYFWISRKFRNVRSTLGGQYFQVSPLIL